MQSLGSNISLKQFDVIYRNIYRLAQRPGLGLDFGMALNISRWGMLTSALLCADTLGHALTIADEFRVILRSRFSIHTSEKAGEVTFQLALKPGMQYPVNEEFAYEIFIGSLCSQISLLTARPFRFNAIAMPYAKPKHAKHYQKVAKGQVHFAAPRAQLSLPAELMHRPLPLANRVTCKQALEQCQTELERVKQARNGDIVYTVRALLAQSEGQPPELQKIAEQLSMSPRTLRRKLQQQQVQYRHLCEQQRQQTALVLLSTTDLSLKEISHRCGFVDSASFNKAFKRWSGEPPAQYRLKLSADN